MIRLILPLEKIGWVRVLGEEGVRWINVDAASHKQKKGIEADQIQIIIYYSHIIIFNFNIEYASKISWKTFWFGHNVLRINKVILL